MFKFVFIFTLTVLAIANAAEEKCVGCIQNLEGEDVKKVEQVLNHSLTKLAAGDGPNYTISKIIEASSQVVSGMLYRIKAELNYGDSKTKICDIRIHSQPWLDNGIEVTFNCPEEEEVTRKHSA